MEKVIVFCFLSILFFSCSDENEISYPRSFSFDKISVNDTKLFTKEGNELSSFDLEGSFLKDTAYFSLVTIEDIENGGGLLNVTLLSDSKVNITFSDGNTEIMQEFSYDVSNSDLDIEGYADVFTISDDREYIYYNYQWSRHKFWASPTSTDFTNISSSELKTQSNLESWANELVTDSNFLSSSQDSLGLMFWSYNYKYSN